jgi:hypothetical protein
LQENQNTHFVFSNFFISENPAVVEKMWKNFCRDGQATYDKMAREHCMLDT